MGIIQKIQEKKVAKMTAEFSKSGMLRYFHYDFGSMGDGMVSYTITQESEELRLVYQKISMRDGASEEKEIILPLVTMQFLKKLIQDEKIYLWNGFNKTNSVIATGTSFNFKMDFDNYKFKAEGMVMLPQDYDVKHKILVDYLNELIV